MNEQDIPRFGADRNFVKMHRIRKLEQKIVSLATLLFACETKDAKNEVLKEMRVSVELLAELEADS